MTRDIYSRVYRDISLASNIKIGQNPSFTVDDFLTFYPQFGTEADPLISTKIIEEFIDLANAYINIARYNKSWKLCMCLFIAHFLTLYLQTIQAAADDGSNPDAAAVISSAQGYGMVTSTSIGDVSESLDYNMIANDLDGWAAWKLTIYGTQLATFAKMKGKGGILIW